MIMVDDSHDENSREMKDINMSLRALMLCMHSAAAFVCRIPV